LDNCFSLGNDLISDWLDRNFEHERSGLFGTFLTYTPGNYQTVATAATHIWPRTERYPILLFSY
jgi:hypothetical protein